MLPVRYSILLSFCLTTVPLITYGQTRDELHVLTPAPNTKSESEIKKETFAKCISPRGAFGDLVDFGLPNWSVGMTASTPAAKYTFGTKQTSSAIGLGAGVAFRYYGKSRLGNEAAAKDLGFADNDLAAIRRLENGKYFRKAGEGTDAANDTYFLPLHKISTECRATTSDIGKDRTEKLAAAVLSITPTIYYAKQANDNDLSIQPALLIGFFDDIINIGPGFNLSGPEKGKVFLVFSLGYGFKF
jgi:hypothetical protein